MNNPGPIPAKPEAVRPSNNSKHILGLLIILLGIMCLPLALLIIALTPKLLAAFGVAVCFFVGALGFALVGLGIYLITGPNSRPIRIIIAVCGVICCWGGLCCWGAFVLLQSDESSNADTLDGLRKHAERGDAEAQYQLGSRYLAGEGIPKDDVQALAWLRKAANQGLAAAQFSLAESELSGLDKTEQAELLRKAAEQGHANAQSELGYCYWLGSGVPKDRVQAYMWLNVAATKYSGAVNGRDELAEEMTPEQIAQAQRLSSAFAPGQKRPLQKPIDNTSRPVAASNPKLVQSAPISVEPVIPDTPEKAAAKADYIKQYMQVKNFNVIVDPKDHSPCGQGTIANRGEKKLDAVTVTIFLFDAENRIVKKFNVENQSLPPYGSRPFTVQIDSPSNWSGPAVALVTGILF